MIYIPRACSPILNSILLMILRVVPRFVVLVCLFPRGGIQLLRATLNNWIGGFIRRVKPFRFNGAYLVLPNYLGNAGILARPCHAQTGQMRGRVLFP